MVFSQASILRMERGSCFLNVAVKDNYDAWNSASSMFCGSLFV